MRRSLVHSRSVRMDGSLSFGKTPLVWSPTMSVSWPRLGNVGVSMPLVACKLDQMAPPPTPPDSAARLVLLERWHGVCLTAAVILPCCDQPPQKQTAADRTRFVCPQCGRGQDGKYRKSETAAARAW